MDQSNNNGFHPPPPPSRLKGMRKHADTKHSNDESWYQNNTPNHFPWRFPQYSKFNINTWPIRSPKVINRAIGLQILKKKEKLTESANILVSIPNVRSSSAVNDQINEGLPALTLALVNETLPNLTHVRLHPTHALKEKKFVRLVNSKVGLRSILNPRKILLKISNQKLLWIKKKFSSERKRAKKKIVTKTLKIESVVNGSGRMSFNTKYKRLKKNRRN